MVRSVRLLQTQSSNAAVNSCVPASDSQAAKPVSTAVLSLLHKHQHAIFGGMALILLLCLSLAVFSVRYLAQIKLLQKQLTMEHSKVAKAQNIVKEMQSNFGS